MIARVLRPQDLRFATLIFVALVLCAWFCGFLQPALAQNVRLFEDNADSIAVVIGNKSYRQTVSVDFAHNDAEAMRDFLSRSLGFRDRNIRVLEDATLSDFNQMFGTERNPQSGQLWRAVKEGRSNVFVYFSGHGVPDLQTRQPFLLPSDGYPSQIETGFPLDTLYRNLEEVKRKVGPNRQVIVMIDACFTGETGRKGESLITVSAPGFVPARPRTGPGVVKLLATSAASPANWDQEDKLGLFTSRFLLGAAGLARISDAKPDLSWAELRRFVIDSVTEGARREMGREQVPEIDEAALTLKPDGPVPAIEPAYGRMRDEAGWRAAETANTIAAYENYAAHCGTICAFRDRALDAAVARRKASAAEADQANWQKLSALGEFEKYLEGCGMVCAYRDLAKRYLALARPVAPAPPPAAPLAPAPPPAAAAPVATAVVAPPVVVPRTPGPCGTGPTTVSLSSRCPAPLTVVEERALKPKDAFRECDKCPEMVMVPAGTFTMGGAPDEEGVESSEVPQHRVALGQALAVGRFSVTFDEWDACVADGGCNRYRPDDKGWGRGLRPVINVSWNDAKIYVAWLSRKTGKAYRLLSEAEREYVTRAGTTTPFWWGSSISTEYANYDGRRYYNKGSRGEFRQRTLPVDSFEPNPWGLYQVHGNVREWTEDCFHLGYNGAPSDGSAWTTGDCSRREGRGGSWYDDPSDLRAAYRAERPINERSNSMGLRVVRTLLTTPIAPK